MSLSINELLTRIASQGIPNVPANEGELDNPAIPDGPTPKGPPPIRDGYRRDLALGPGARAGDGFVFGGQEANRIWRDERKELFSFDGWISPETQAQYAGKPDAPPDDFSAGQQDMVFTVGKSQLVANNSVSLLQMARSNYQNQVMGFQSSPASQYTAASVVPVNLLSAMTSAHPSNSI